MTAWQQRGHGWRRLGFGGTATELADGRPFLDVVTAGINQPWAAPAPDLGPLERTGSQGQAQRAWQSWLWKQYVETENPFREKMVEFWRDRLVVSGRGVRVPHLLADYDRRLREGAFGDYRELLWQVTTSPAMVVYLNNQQNRRNGLNENLARELLELFSVGRGVYTEVDVREAARALTGWVVRYDADQAYAEFVPQRHDGGRKTLLGQTGNFGLAEVVTLLANHPATAQKLAADLWGVLVYPEPSPSIVAEIAAVYQRSGRNLGAVVQAIVRHPEFESDRAYRAQIKTPVQFLVGAVRQLGIAANPTRAWQGLRAMGQVPYNAPTVKGWPQGEGWLTAPSLLTRLALADALTGSYGDDSGFAWNAQDWTSEDLVAVLVDGQPDNVLWSAVRGLGVRETAAAILASPLYQLA
ncbi:MAG: DUF1800 domain-containing protein [Pseudanabaenaceae cyanobacterium]